MRRHCGNPDLTELPKRQGSFDRRTCFGEMDMHLRNGLIAHDDDAMAKL